VSGIEEGNGDRTPAKATQKVSRAVVWVNHPTSALLLKRCVGRAEHHAEFFANKSGRPEGEQRCA
jgi:hypothetical protein